MHGLQQQKPGVNNNTGELAGTAASVFSELAFFLICC